MDFDRLTFDTASALLRPESEEQLQNIASIMKAYPNLRPSSQFGCARPDAIPELLQEHRVLEVFDDVRRPIPIIIPAQGRGSVLVTTRDASIAAGALLKVSPVGGIHAKSPADKLQQSL